MREINSTNSTIHSTKLAYYVSFYEASLLIQMYF